MTSQTFYERFLEKYRIVESGCWEWTASTDTGGYGRIGVAPGRVDGAHRVSWKMHWGEIPKGMYVCHRCDNRRCINPEHLFLGSAKDNAYDMIAKGRNSRGQKHGHAVIQSLRGFRKLDSEKVKQIRLLLEQGVSQRTIAKKFGVSQGAISHIKNGLYWMHVEAA